MKWSSGNMIWKAVKTIAIVLLVYYLCEYLPDIIRSIFKHFK